MNEMKLGWFIGNFSPSLLKTDKVEIGIKRFKKGETEPTHHQLSATEWTCVIEGKIRMGDSIFCKDEIIEIVPMESADFEALEDCVVVVVKVPSIPSDKKID